MMYDEKSLSDKLPVYYARFFPHKEFCRWISCGNSPHPLENRELSFTLADDVYLRYISISNRQELLTLLQQKKPLKLDIGAVYNTKPSIGRHDAVVVARELVFDIDLTDYDDVRTCCQEATVCQKCWRFLVIACEIIHKALKKDFGFKNILWVFSGRRGIHCWVSDYEARILDSAGRAAIADYLCLVMGGDNKNKKVHLKDNKLHSSITRAIDIIDNYFHLVMKDQQFLSTPERKNYFLQMIPDESFRNQVDRGIERIILPSEGRWEEFLSLYHQYCKENGGTKMKYLIEEIKLQYCYPRLDVNVTKGFNHLLKSPFSIHPKTGKVSVVIKPANAKNMILDNMPTIDSLLEHDPENIEDVQKHQMDISVAVFYDFVCTLEKDEALRKRNEASKSLDF